MGAHLAALQAVFRSYQPKYGFFGGGGEVTNKFLALKSKYSWVLFNYSGPNMMGIQWDNFLVLSILYTGSRGPKANFKPNNLCFTQLPLKYCFLYWMDLTRENMMCPHPNLTLDTFGFAVSSNLAAWSTVLEIQIAKVEHLGDPHFSGVPLNVFILP